KSMNCLYHHNLTNGVGAAIVCYGAIQNVYNATITENGSVAMTAYGGLWASTYGEIALISLYINSIFWNNLPDASPPFQDNNVHDTYPLVPTEVEYSDIQARDPTGPYAGR